MTTPNLFLAVTACSFRGGASELAEVTPLIITYNEEANIERTLAALTWADRIVIVDSGSTDQTLRLIAKHPRAEVHFRTFDNFADQCEFGLSLIKTRWCLSLDADHVVSQAFRREMEEVLEQADDDVAAICTPFRYWVAGRPLRGTLLPARFNLIRPGFGCYRNDGHGHQFAPSGRTLRMRQPIDHDDRKPLERWLNAQRNYLLQEAKKLLNTPKTDLCLADRLRLNGVLAPFAVLVLCLIRHQGILDGWRGWFYAFQRVYVEILLKLIIWEQRHIRE